MSLHCDRHKNCDLATLDERRGSSQIVGIHKSPRPLIPVPRALTTSEGTSSDSSESDNDSDTSRCPFLNKEQYLPQFKAARDQLRGYFRQKNRMAQLTKKPWIFMLQFVKLVLITTMLVTLTDNNYGIKSAVSEIKEAVSSLLIKDYKPTVERRMVYSFAELDNMTLYALKEYFCLADTAISLLGYPGGLKPDYPPPVKIKMEHYDTVNITNHWTVYINSTVLPYTVNVKCPLCDHDCVDGYKEDITARRFPLGLLKYSMTFPLQLLLIGYLSKPHCVSLLYELIFSNSLETGFEIHYWMHYDFKKCNSSTTDSAEDIGDYKYKYIGYIALDASVMLISVLSTVVVINKMIVAFNLCTKTRKFVEKTYKRRMTRREKHVFVNYWYLCILLADTLIITASLLKLLIDTEVDYNFDLCTLFLGIGVWLSYLGLLRYLAFNKHYSMLLNTIVVALPHLARFMICVIIVSLAYIFCGWLVLSPYNRKFTSFWVTMETLFSLLNGDDMFATFDLVKTRNSVHTQHMVLIFSRIYLYSYVCFFIYVVLSLCISIIEDAYMVVSNYRSDSCPWVQDPTVLPEFATSWERNLRRRSKCSGTGGNRTFSNSWKS